MLREKLRTTTAVRGRAYVVVAHQQAAMPDQLLASEPADPEYDDQEPKAGRGEAIDLTALRALRKSRTDVEVPDLTADRLRRPDRTAAQADADVVRPDDQQAHRPQQPGPHRGREAGH
ncbi:hypothetical protein [Streptomyces rochei]